MSLCFIVELANGTGNEIDDILESTGAGSSNTNFINENLVSGHLDEENSRQSSCEALSPNVQDYSEDEGDSDISSDDLN